MVCAIFTIKKYSKKQPNPTIFFCAAYRNSLKLERSHIVHWQIGNTEYGFTYIFSLLYMSISYTVSSYTLVLNFKRQMTICQNKW